MFGPRMKWFKHLGDPDCIETIDQSGSESELEPRAEQPGSAGNVSEITVVGLVGVNTVADGEQPRPAQQKGYSAGGEKNLWLILSSLSTLSSFVVCRLHYGAQSPQQAITLLSK